MKARGQRHQGRITLPAGKVELSAETRAVVANLQRAHDDDDVTTADFTELVKAAWRHIGALPERERLEVAGQIFATSVGGRYLGWTIR